jgi:hypothetical protein
VRASQAEMGRVSGGEALTGERGQLENGQFWWRGTDRRTGAVLVAWVSASLQAGQEESRQQPQPPHNDGERTVVLGLSETACGSLVAGGAALALVCYTLCYTLCPKPSMVRYTLCP